jgi:hypothetical protein
MDMLCFGRRNDFSASPDLQSNLVHRESTPTLIGRLAFQPRDCQFRLDRGEEHSLDTSRKNAYISFTFFPIHILPIPHFSISLDINSNFYLLVHCLVKSDVYVFLISVQSAAMATLEPSEGPFLASFDESFLDFQMPGWIDSMDLSSQFYADSNDQSIEDLDFEFFDYHFAELDMPIKPDLADSHDTIQTLGSQAKAASPRLASTSLLGTLLPNTPSTKSSDPTRKYGKRRFEECLFEFEGTRPAPSNSNRRKAFSNEGRKKVGRVRQAGACVRCRIMKISVILFVWGRYKALLMILFSAILNYHVLAASKYATTIRSAGLSAIARSCWMLDSQQVGCLRYHIFFADSSS